MTNIPNIGKDTIARTVAAALALLNSALVMAGKAPLNLDESGLYEAVSILAAASTTVWAWWKELEAERGGLGPDADPGAEEAADLS